MIVDPTADFDSDRRASVRRHVWGFGALAVAALLLLAMAINANRAASARDTALAWQLHTLEVLLAAEQSRAAINQALRGERGYLLTRDPEFLEPYSSGSRDAPLHLARLRNLTADNPRQRANLEALETTLPRYLAFLERTVSLARQQRVGAAIARVKTGEGRREIEAMLAGLARVELEERRLLSVRAAAGKRAERLAYWANYGLAALGALFLLLVGAAGYFASKARTKTLDTEAQLRRAATTDDLTGLLNRRAFLGAVEVEIARSARSGSPLALAILDIDHFKQINDRFGHQGGDEILRSFAATARSTTRAADVIGRLGGEEFAVLMPDTDRIQSGTAGERLRHAIARRRTTLSNGTPVPITVSVGVAHHQPGETPDRLLRRADEAMYEAKNSGRNRTRLAA